MPYLPIIGLEIHLRLKTHSKMFCSCPNVPEDTLPNTAICPVCTGQPGALPALNAEAVRLGVRLGLALGCAIPNEAHFDRKNYFYPDLPKGYQISQYDFPIAQNGTVQLETRRIDITRAHLEEDAAKNIHDKTSQTTLVDFNRCGTPLLEIVTEPDFRDPAEAKLFLQELQAIARATGASDADMEKGYMRCDANISLLPIDENGTALQPGWNPKTEVKNLNSFRAVERALHHEMERQIALLDSGVVPTSATRGWNEHSEETFEQRSKETNADYRYFPEPDLLPLDLQAIRDTERNRLPEFPAAKRVRLQKEYGFDVETARVLVANHGWADYAEQVMSELDTDNERDPRIVKLFSGWFTSKLAGLLIEKNTILASAPISPENFAEFLRLLASDAIGSANAQRLLSLMLDTGTDPSHLLEEHDLGQSMDRHLITTTVARIIEQNPDQATSVRAGKINLLMWFVGGVMKATEGKADPKQAEEEIKKQLGIG